MLFKAKKKKKTFNAVIIHTNILLFTLEITHVLKDECRVVGVNWYGLESTVSVALLISICVGEDLRRCLEM